MLSAALAIQTSTLAVAATLLVLLPLVKAEFHLSFAEAGVLANLPLLGGFLAIALAGWAVDAFGDRVILALGGVVTGIAAIASALAPNFLILVGALLAVGAGASMPTPAGIIAVRNAFPLRLQGMVMSLSQTGFPLGVPRGGATA